MTIDNPLFELMEKAIRKIKDATEKRDSRLISYYTAILQEAEELVRKSEAITEALEELTKRIASPPDFEELTAHRALRSNLSQYLSSPRRARPSDLGRRDPSPTPRMTGEYRRQNFVEELSYRGVELIHEGGSLYKTQEGGLVGIAYASERQRNRWFLGLPQRDYFCVVLLCESRRGEILNFIFPEDFYVKHKDEYSESGGQLKFNLVLKWDKYQMTIPGVGPITIDDFKDNYKALKPKK